MQCLLMRVLISAEFFAVTHAAVAHETAALIRSQSERVGPSAVRAKRDRRELLRSMLVKDAKRVVTAGRCAGLVNKGTHSVINVSAGTPMNGHKQQWFQLVADTGSNSVILPSIQCNASQACLGTTRFFQGSERSSTFMLEKENGTNQSITEVITFGSGQVEAVRAQDVVTVAGLHQNMTGLLLMISNDLGMEDMDFQGILGLGRPCSSLASAEHEETAQKVRGVNSGDISQSDALKKIIDEMSGGAGAAETPKQTMAQTMMQGAMKNASGPCQREGFMEQTNTQYFSMCFNEHTDGVLRFGAAPAHHTDHAMASVGQAHWGMAFNGGISVQGSEGSASLSTFCNVAHSPLNTSAGQESVCGAIPDSGTTVTMAPKAQLLQLFETTCDKWPRCKENHTKFEQAIDDASAAFKADYGFDALNLSSQKTGLKQLVFQLLLLDCESWMNDTHNLNTLPELFFHLSGSNNTDKSISLKGWAYVLEETNSLASNASTNGTNGSLAMQHANFLETIFSSFVGVGSGAHQLLQKAAQVPSSSSPASSASSGSSDSSMGGFDFSALATRSKLCRPAFGEMDYNTEKNGDVWILGTPFFYQYQVGFGLNDQTVSFTSVETAGNECGSCDAGTPSPTPAPTAPRSLLSGARRPRRVDAPWRKPTLGSSLLEM